MFFLDGWTSIFTTNLRNNGSILRWFYYRFSNFVLSPYDNYPGFLIFSSIVLCFITLYLSSTYSPLTEPCGSFRLRVRMSSPSVLCRPKNGDMEVLRVLPYHGPCGPSTYFPIFVLVDRNFQTNLNALFNLEFGEGMKYITCTTEKRWIPFYYF